MQWLDLTLPAPAANLALDEALLDQCEAGLAGECLRFWEPTTPFVVVGYGQRIQIETLPNRCEQDGIPILRRCSGGGTVLQGPGCLNYTLVLSLQNRPELATVPGANHHIMERHRQLFARLLQGPVTVEGHTDLAFEGRKFSGNAQRRRRQCLLFHGTFLLAPFQIDQVSQCLPLPSRQPPYRRNRSHDTFLTTLPHPAAEIRQALRQLWKAEGPAAEQWPAQATSRLEQSRYANRAWVWRL